MDRRIIFDAARMTADLSLSHGRIELSDGVETAVVQRIFTDRQARPDDDLPDGPNGDRRGWCRPGR